MASPAFRRRQEDLGRMATELMALVQDGKIRPTMAEQITMEAIPKELERLAEGHVRDKIIARMQGMIRVSMGDNGPRPGDCRREYRYPNA